MAWVTQEMVVLFIGWMNVLHLLKEDPNQPVAYSRHFITWVPNWYCFGHKCLHSGLTHSTVQFLEPPF